MSKVVVNGKVDAKLRSPLGVARGLGAAHSGFEHWWEQRMSSLALVPLGLWFALSLASLAGADHPAVRAWISQPLSATLLVLFIGVAFQHAASGMQVVYEDYVSNEPARMICVIGTKFLFFLVAALCIVSVLKIAFGG